MSAIQCKVCGGVGDSDGAILACHRCYEAKPMPPEVVAVLRAADTETMTLDHAQALSRWKAAGRPGLPPLAGAGREEK